MKHRIRSTECQFKGLLNKPKAFRAIIAGLISGLLSLGATQNASAANQTWTNSPVDGTWSNTNNWVARAVPGAVNLTGNSVNNDVATFNSPIASGIGSGANPILTDNATTINTTAPRSRQIGGITFDTANCGAYAMTNASAINVTDTNFVFSGVLYVSHNGSIQITAPVTNSQRIMVPLMSRGPSSTDGIYNFINNAVTSSATLFFNAVTSNIGTTRGTLWILDGSNTGTNTIAALSRGNNGSATQQGIRKQGTGTWILSGPNDMNNTAGSTINVNQGTLIVRDAGALGATANVFANSNAVLQIDGVTLNQPSVNLTRNGTIRMNGTASLNGVAVGSTVAGISPTLATTSASDVFTVGTALTTAAFVTGGAADSVLNTAGPGTLVFGQGNTYAGKWNFAAATNQISNPSALGAGANANVAAGAVLDLTPLGATTVTPTTSGFGGSGRGTTVGSTAATVLTDAGATIDLTGKAVNLTFTPTSASGDTAHPALYIAQGTLALSGSGNTFFVNNASGSALGVGTYRLIQQASGNVTAGGGHAVIVSGSGITSGNTTAIQVSGGNVDLVISPYVQKNLVWTGGNPDTTWNIIGSANFLNGASPSVFNNSDNVTFNSIGSTNPTVTLSGTLAPGSLTVDTSGNNYTFTGSGQVAGTTSLLKTGAGTLLVQTVNSYAGGTVVSNGV
ncbi:MAG TPA: autotransporter-associated beta strand repeat-containing protein, partial [Candidatus Dormibacteraeota bacterium]|nr:autotransporter-associated beta strand repeat-containing protein [Candidatus Dormibacteraeota bacterium]